LLIFVVPGLVILHTRPKMVSDAPARKGLGARHNLSLRLDCLRQPPAPAQQDPCQLASYSCFMDKYGDLGKTLGVGTVATVRVATRQSDGQKVAVKVIASTDDEVRTFAKDEYELMTQLKHPNIVKVEALHECPQKLWIVMELCPRGSLHGHVHHRGALPQPCAVELFQHLLWGVNFLHLKRIVHRDIKPENLLVCDDATPQGKYILKITDFNSAKRIGLGATASLMLTERGTSFYSAPELRLGKIWNERVDIWAAGMCFYFMRCARAPFNLLETGDEKLLRSGCLPEVSTAGFSNLASSLLLQCLTVEMRDRPAAMELVLHPLFQTDEHGANRRSRSCEPALENPILVQENQSQEAASAASRRARRMSFQSAPSTSQAKSPMSAETSFPEFSRSDFSRQISEPVHQVVCPGKESRKHSDEVHQVVCPWKESRKHSDVLQMLANMRCERALHVDTESQRTSPKASSHDDPSLSPTSPTSETGLHRWQGSEDTWEVPLEEVAGPSPTPEQHREQRAAMRKRRNSNAPRTIQFFTTHAAFDQDA